MCDVFKVYIERPWAGAGGDKGKTETEVVRKSDYDLLQTELQKVKTENLKLLRELDSL